MKKTKTKEVTPLLIIGFPCNISHNVFQEAINNLRDLHQKDYFIIPYIQNKSSEFKFEVFYDKDWKETSYEELKNELLSNYK